MIDEEQPKTSFQAEEVVATRVEEPPAPDLTECTVETNTHKFSVQTGPNLIISINKESGEEIHHSDPAIIADLWEKIKEYVAKNVHELESKIDNPDAPKDAQ